MERVAGCVVGVGIRVWWVWISPGRVNEIGDMDGGAEKLPCTDEQALDVRHERTDLTVSWSGHCVPSCAGRASAGERLPAGLPHRSRAETGLDRRGGISCKIESTKRLVGVDMNM